MMLLTPSDVCSEKDRCPFWPFLLIFHTIVEGIFAKIKKHEFNNKNTSLNVLNNNKEIE